MNELIRKLAKKSGFRLDSNGIYTAKLEHLPITENMEKFAELIVKECADIMDGRDENGNAKDGQYLLTQFGIDASQRYT
jgi:hypothetical protein